MGVKKEWKKSLLSRDFLIWCAIYRLRICVSFSLFLFLCKLRKSHSDYNSMFRTCCPNLVQINGQRMVNQMKIERVNFSFSIQSIMQFLYLYHSLLLSHFHVRFWVHNVHNSEISPSLLMSFDYFVSFSDSFKWYSHTIILLLCVQNKKKI